MNSQCTPHRERVRVNVLEDLNKWWDFHLEELHSAILQAFNESNYVCRAMCLDHVADAVWPVYYVKGDSKVKQRLRDSVDVFLQLKTFERRSGERKRVDV